MFNGKLGKDPEYKKFESGNVQATVSVAVSYKAISDWQKARANDHGYTTTWFKVKAIGEEAANSLMKLTKGDHVTIPDPMFSEDEYVGKDGNTYKDFTIATFTPVQVGYVKYGESPETVPAPKGQTPATAGTVSTWGGSR